MNDDDEEEGESEDNWMDTYADAITLLMAFFVVLLAMSSMDKKKYDHMREALSEGVNQSAIEQVTKAFEQKDDASQSFTLLERPIPSLDQFSYLVTIASVEEHKTSFGKEIIIPADLIFVPNSTTIRDDAEPIVSAVSEHILKLDARFYIVSIEGHTDGDPYLVPKFSSAWEYSSERAIAFRSAMMAFMVNPEMISVAAYADTRPLKAILDEYGKVIPENRARNSRIVVSIRQKD